MAKVRARALRTLRRGLLAVTLLSAAVSLGCSKKTASVSVPSGQVEPADASPPWLTRPSAPVAPKGMVWIPPGALVAGTPPDRVPRLVDREMPGQQLILEGFFIDMLAYPNEPAAIPLSNVSQEEARTLCQARSKRLCSELEWERACKGPSNSSYEYGDRYRAEACGTGEVAKLMPSGFRVGCRSDFGVHDLHGGVWEWTDSPWGRGGPAAHVTLRGGNGPNGEVVGRCAHARSSAPGVQAPDIGFRCCSGERNAAEVVLRVEQGQALELAAKVEPKWSAAVSAALPEEASKGSASKLNFVVNRMWHWRPVGNEELAVFGVCSAGASPHVCGVLVARNLPGKLQPLAWASSGSFVPSVQVDHVASELWVYGADKKNHFRQRLSYNWATVTPGRIELNPRSWAHKDDAIVPPKKVKRPTRAP